MYFLRSHTKKYVCADMEGKNKTMKIMLMKLPILENPANHKGIFYLKHDGQIEMKGKDTYDLKKVYALFATALVLTTIILFKCEYQTYKQKAAKYMVIPARLKNLNIFIKNTIINIKEKWLYYNYNHKSLITTKTRKEVKKVKRKTNVCYNDIRDYLFIHTLDSRTMNSYIKPNQLSFIEEQCRINKGIPKIADNFDDSSNISMKNIDIDTFPNFASFSEGAKIITTPNTEAYVKYKVHTGILQYILGIKYFNIDQLPICKFSKTLCSYFLTGPSSLLQPWSKPGECWSFEGSRGNIQIELTDRIYITAVTLEHIPLKQSSPAVTRSAPKIFSIVGIDDWEEYRFTSRNLLGIFEYRLTEPNIQTFSLPEESSNYSYRIVELVVESNHGNENYTCVYRLRVHGHKEKIS